MPENTTFPESGGSYHESGGPVRSVSVITTGTGEVHYEHIYGTYMPALWWIFFGRRWVTVPVNLYLIEHSDGLILFDAGMDRAVMTDPDFWPEGFTGTIMRHLFRFHIDPDDTLTRQLEKSGYSAGEVRKAVISHLHCDHVGGIREIPQAKLYVSREEWDNMFRPHPERHMVFRRDIEIEGAKWEQISFKPTEDPSVLPFTHSFDLMGDGSMLLLPTPGHTPGSLSMLVRRDDGPPLFFIGDLAYTVELLECGRMPGTGDEKELRASFAKVLALRKRMPDLVILGAHDPDAAEALRKAHVPESTGDRN